MADYDTSPNFVNPAYATPEQLATQRAYAAELMKRSGQNVTRPAGALANMIDALTGSLERNRATDIQQQAAAQNAKDISTISAQLREGGPPAVDPNLVGRVYANPMASPEHRALASQLMTPNAVQSAFGNRGYQSPMMGTRASPSNLPEGAPVSQAVEGASMTGPSPSPYQAPIPRARTNVPGYGTSTGGLGYQIVGPAPPQGGQPPTAAAPPPVAPRPAPPPPGAAAPPIQATTAGGFQPPGGMMEQLFQTGQRMSFEKGRNEAVKKIQDEDIVAATNAPQVKRLAGIITDNLNTFGDKMTMGPTAEWSNNMKRIAANYAPGFMKDQLNSLAAADSLDKASAQLAGILGRGVGGTDAQLFNNIKSVPGAHNSLEGAKELAAMVDQLANQQQALRTATAGARTAQEYEAARDNFFRRNPIINTLTGRPIIQDLRAAKEEQPAAGGTGVSIDAIAAERKRRQQMQGR